MRLWNVATGHQIGQPLGHTQEIHSVVFSPDGKILASGGGSRSGAGTVRLWDVATGRQIATPLTDTNWISSVAFSPDGKILASGGADGTVRLWDVAAHRQIGAPFSSHAGVVSSVAFSPDGKTLAWAGTKEVGINKEVGICLLYTSPSPRDRQKSRMPSSA